MNVYLLRKGIVTTEPFYTKTRLRSVKRAIRDNREFAHSGECDREVIDFLEDLADSAAARHPGGEVEAFHYMMRCMGVLVRRHAAAAYKPYGYRNPFAPWCRTAPQQPAPGPAARTWSWPVVHPVLPRPAGQFDAIFREFSALKMFGYTVGKTKGWPRDKRHAFLTDFMEMDLPDVVEELFGDEYGAPLSTDRLRQMANVIASNAGLAKRRDPIANAAAIADWEDDLAFLKGEFYERRGLKFLPWPSAQPR